MDSFVDAASRSRRTNSLYTNDVLSRLTQSEIPRERQRCHHLGRPNLVSHGCHLPEYAWARLIRSDRYPPIRGVTGRSCEQVPQPLAGRTRSYLMCQRGSVRPHQVADLTTARRIQATSARMATHPVAGFREVPEIFTDVRTRHLRSTRP